MRSKASEQYGKCSPMSSQSSRRDERGEGRKDDINQDISYVDSSDLSFTTEPKHTVSSWNQLYESNLFTI